jgi:hypothetical protein
VNWNSKLAEALISLIAVAVVARVVWGLLGPLLPSLVVLLTVGAILRWLVRGPHARR